MNGPWPGLRSDLVVLEISLKYMPYRAASSIQASGGCNSRALREKAQRLAIACRSYPKSRLGVITGTTVAELGTDDATGIRMYRHSRWRNLQ
jgi:hypothetical protein